LATYLGGRGKVSKTRRCTRSRKKGGKKTGANCLWPEPWKKERSVNGTGSREKGKGKEGVLGVSHSQFFEEEKKQDFLLREKLAIRPLSPYRGHVEEKKKRKAQSKGPPRDMGGGRRLAACAQFFLVGQ